MAKQVIICSYSGCTKEIRANTKTGRCSRHANCKLVIPIPIEIIECSCGCGETIPRFQKLTGRIIERKYVHGHNSPKTAIKVPCSNCEKIIEKRPHQLERSKIHCCNRKCWGAYKSKFYTVTVHCSRCDKSFVVPRARADKGNKNNKMYCSTNCLVKSQRTITKCSYCHKDMDIINWRAQKRNNVFCDNECQKQWETEINIGENHPLWTGTRKHKRGKNWRRMRRQVLKRDKKTCRLCGGHHRIAVHHIMPFRFFGNPEDANTLDNLITLCIHCHGKVEPKTKDNPINEKLKRIVKQSPNQMTLGI